MLAQMQAQIFRAYTCWNVHPYTRDAPDALHAEIEAETLVIRDETLSRSRD